MGWVSYSEDIQEAIDARQVEDWRIYLGERPQKRDIVEARAILGDPFAYPRRLVSEFWRYYNEQVTDVPRRDSRWEQHLSNLRKLAQVLAPTTALGQQPEKNWIVLQEIEKDVQAFFKAAQIYGPVSRRAIDEMRSRTTDIQQRCRNLQTDLQKFQRRAATLPAEVRSYDIESALGKLRTIQTRLEADFDTLSEFSDATERVEQLWARFLDLFATVPLQINYRPVLHELNRLRLNPVQESLVSMVHEGWYRVHGASGSGKTLVVIHRGWRLASANPHERVRVFTINRSLSEHIRSTVEAIYGKVPRNLTISSIYDFLLQCLDLSEDVTQYRLREPLTPERASKTWSMFFNHKGTDRKHNVFADDGVKRLLASIQKQGAFSRAAAGEYLRDEMIYIQSAYPRSSWSDYLRDPRTGRCLPLNSDQREKCLRVLDAWEDWLQTGGLCDIYGVSSRAARYFTKGDSLSEIRARFPTHHVLVDEVQDASSLELRMLRSLITKPERRRNAFFFVGDTNQKIYVKHHSMASAGFPMQGRVSRLTQNYRNTRQILRAAWCIAEAFPPRVDAEEAVELIRPDLSSYEGGSPVAYRCAMSNHEDILLRLLHLRRRNRVALVSENERLLAGVQSKLRATGAPYIELLCNDDLDRWSKQSVAPLSARLVLGRLDAVKGYEFDTVIVADLSADVVPSPCLPPDEHWREAAIVYSALTRARDELVLTYTGRPSVFLTRMNGCVQHVDAPETGQMDQLLERNERRA